MKGATKIFKAIIIIAMICSNILLTDLPTVHAQNNSFDLEQEISEKRAAGITVYELYTDDGEIMGYFEPFTETNVMAMARNTILHWNLDIPSKTNARGEHIYSFVKGDTIIVNISQDPSGSGYASYIGLYDNDNGTYSFPENGATTIGWDGGTLTVGYSGHFSFAIRNASNNTIHYEGTYSF